MRARQEQKKKSEEITYTNTNPAGIFFFMSVIYFRV